MGRSLSVPKTLESVSEVSLHLMNLKIKFHRHYLFAVDNYDPLIEELAEVKKAIPTSEAYVDKVSKDIKDQKQAAISGNMAEMARTVRKGARDVKAGAQSVESNKELLEVAEETAPNALEDLAAGFAKGTKTAADEDELMGKFEKMVEDALADAEN